MKIANNIEFFTRWESLQRHVETILSIAYTESASAEDYQNTIERAQSQLNTLKQLTPTT